MNVQFEGLVTAVKPRINLFRSFDQVWHAYKGYILVLTGTVEGMIIDPLRIAVGPKAHEEYRFRIGDTVSGSAVPVVDPNTEWATHYKVSGLKLLSRGPEEQNCPANPVGVIAPSLPEYRAWGHLRLDSNVYEAHCLQCPFGIIMPTEITIDQWNPSKKKWRLETHCYGPRDCPHYRPGKPYRVPGRKAGMIWVDDDYEREMEENS